MMRRRRSGAAAFSLLLAAAALVAACGDDTGATASGTGGGSSAGGTGGETSGGGGGEAEAVGEALVALLNVEDEIFEVEIEGDPFAYLPMNMGSGVVFVVPIFDCGAGIGTCVEVFREGLTEPTELAVDDGGTVVHFFAGAAGEEGDVTTDEAIPDPGLGETAVVVRSFLQGPTLTLSAPSGTLNPLDSGVTTVASGQQVVLVLTDGTILETDIVLEEAMRYAITADANTTDGFEVAVCPLEDGEDCDSWSYN